MRLMLVAAALTAFAAGVPAQGIYGHTDPSGRVTATNEAGAFCMRRRFLFLRTTGISAWQAGDDCAGRV